MNPKKNKSEPSTTTEITTTELTSTTLSGCDVNETNCSAVSIQECKYYIFFKLIGFKKV